MLDKIFDARADELGQEDYNEIENEERFLDVVTNVTDEELKEKLTSIYLKDDDEVGEICAGLIEKYYKNGFADGVKLIVECVKVGDGK